MEYPRHAHYLCNKLKYDCLPNKSNGKSIKKGNKKMAIPRYLFSILRKCVLVCAFLFKPRLEVNACLAKTDGYCQFSGIQLLLIIAIRYAIHKNM